MKAEAPQAQPPQEKPAFPVVVQAVENAWNNAVMQQPEGHVDYDDVAQVVADRLNQDHGFLWQRRQDGLAEKITSAEVLATRENFFKA